MDRYCCKLECFKEPRCQVDGMACSKCRSFSYCKCKCKSYKPKTMPNERPTAWNDTATSIDTL